MGPRCRTSVAFGFAFGVLLGSALVIYLKLWTIDSTFSSNDRELLRKEFDHANMEAMDESAEWRMKYDAEVERTGQCKEELERVKATSLKLEALQKENTLLHNQMESLIHSKDFQCKCNGSSTSV